MTTYTKQSEWENQEVSITLTNKEWNRLDVFLLMSTHFREQERDGWRKLAEERDEFGNVVFRNAESNAEFWQSQIDLIAKVQNALNDI